MTIADMEWRLADPFAVQDSVANPVPLKAGLYLWLERTTAGPEGLPSDRVPYVGESKNLRDRLHRYSAVSYTREDSVIRSVFDRVIAPQLDCEALRDAVVSRRSSCLAQMWIRDHV